MSNKEGSLEICVICQETKTIGLNLKYNELYRGYVCSECSEPIKPFSFKCPVCNKWIEPSNIAGSCPHCDSEGFKTLKMWYSKCHDCPNHFFKDDVLKCNIHIHLPKVSCKDYPRLE